MRGGFTSSMSKFVRKESGILREAEDIIAGVIVTRASMIAPKLTGALQGNGRVIQRLGHAAAKFGDPDVPYARRREFENNKNPHTKHYLKRAGDGVKKENVKKYVDMAR